MQIKKFREMVNLLKRQNRFYATRLKNLPTVKTLEDLTRYPVTLKKELQEDQAKHPPYGTNLTYPLNYYIHYHQTSGTTGKPLKVLDTRESWDWWGKCWKDVYEAAGVSDNDRIFLAFSFGPFIGFWGAYRGAELLGALSIPGGGQTTEQRLNMIMETEATVLVCTPTYALRLGEVAEELGIDLSSSPIKKTIHAGEPGGSIPAIRKRIEDIWGAECYDHAGLSEVGAHSFSCEVRQGLHINELEFIAEVIDPETGEMVEEGEKGELYLTNLGRWGFPVIRYRTGDLVKHSGYDCPCGRRHLFLAEGIIGRVDDMVTIRGVNVFPSAIESIIREITSAEFRITAYTRDEMDELLIEIEEDGDTIQKLGHEIRNRLGIRADIRKVEKGSLPRFELKAKRFVDERVKK